MIYRVDLDIGIGVYVFADFAALVTNFGPCLDPGG